jgi:predicted phosphoribosyltransferase
MLSHAESDIADPDPMNTPSVFADRADAAEALALHLHDYHGRKPLILAIPRGAVPMGKIIAQRLGGELDVVLVRKLGAPFDPEYALGAVDENGWVYLDSPAGLSAAMRIFIEQEKIRQLKVLAQRRAQYTPLKRPADPHGRIAIIVDDGLATGATMIAALHAIRAKHPAELVCAVPVAPPQSLAAVMPFADRVVCLRTPASFSSVSEFYRHFPQVDDREVARILGMPVLPSGPEAPESG